MVELPKCVRTCPQSQLCRNTEDNKEPCPDSLFVAHSVLLLYQDVYFRLVSEKRQTLKYLHWSFRLVVFLGGSLPTLQNIPCYTFLMIKQPPPPALQCLRISTSPSLLGSQQNSRLSDFEGNSIQCCLGSLCRVNCDWNWIPHLFPL